MTDFKDRLGKCYELAGRAVAFDEKGELVHGTIQGFDYPPNPHAWVDTGEGVYDPILDSHLDYDVWEAFASPVEHRRFTADEARKQLLIEKTWGPWNEEGEA